MERAADAAREPGAVQEDARAVDEAGLDLAGLVRLGGPGLAVADVVELPLLGGEALGVGEHRRLVVLVDEVGAVAAAALLELGGGPGEHALAPVAVDARPRAGEERDVEDPGALFVGVLEGDPLVEVVGHSGSWSGEHRA